jgi:hypothetical protein
MRSRDAHSAARADSARAAVAWLAEELRWPAFTWRGATYDTDESLAPFWRTALAEATAEECRDLARQLARTWDAIEETGEPFCYGDGGHEILDVNPHSGAPDVYRACSCTEGRLCARARYEGHRLADVLAEEAARASAYRDRVRAAEAARREELRGLESAILEAIRAARPHAVGLGALASRLARYRPSESSLRIRLHRLVRSGRVQTVTAQHGTQRRTRYYAESDR